VMVLAVQNSVEYSQLGVATSGATLFRSIGGAVGTALFGAIFANRLGVNLARYLPAGTPASELASGQSNPAALARLPADVHTGYIQAYAHSLQTVFLIGVPLAAVAFLLTWLLPEHPLRQSVHTTEPSAATPGPAHL
jgi:hypothetical protein